MEKFFRFNEHGTNFKTEVLAGITTFLTMAYILGVNVSILSVTGLNPEAVFMATAISAAVATIFMGIYANAPIALAPGMGLNAFFAFSVVLGSNGKYGPEDALAMVFLSGIIFFIISILGFRKIIIDSIPKNLKQSIGAAIGFFIAFIGLVKMGVIVNNEATLVSLGTFKNPAILLSIFGLLITIILMSREINSAVFIGLLLTAIIGLLANFLGVKYMPSLPTKIVSFKLDFSAVGIFTRGLPKVLSDPKSIAIVFTMLFVDFFDTAGTLLAVTNKITQTTKIKYNMDKMFLADSIGTVVGSMLGTSNVTSYVESASGVAAGARTGLSSIVVGILFLLSTFFAPLLTVVQSIPVEGIGMLEPIVAPSLTIVGILMATQLSSIDWHDFTSAAAGFTTIIMMILTYSIANGIAAGVIIYVIANLFSKNKKQIPKAIWVLFFVFLAHFCLS